jgi:hypothetical protein
MRLGCVPRVVIVACVAAGLSLAVQAQEPAKDLPGKVVPKQEESKKPKEQKKVFCASRAEPSRVLMVDNINCDERCKGAFKEYECDTNKDLKDGWKITSFAPQEMIITRSPCECKISGTEAQMER